jgi:flavin reductase (DIM6/NTAB) family NADH-FMN oxidoreductase RutF
MIESLSESAFREALSHFASGVTVVTSQSPSGPVGFTASAFTSVSLSPPLVLVCVAKRASIHDVLLTAQRFGVSVLAEEQRWVAEQFARPVVDRVDRFERVPLRKEGSEGVPLLEGALAGLECRHHDARGAGDHTILVGEVLGVSVTAGRPLVHYGRRFGSFSTLSPALVAPAAGGTWKGGEA